jgi:hypothetical protein
MDNEDEGGASLQAAFAANSGPVKQVIAPFVITKLIGRPEVSVYHETGRNAWVVVEADGQIAWEPGTGQWTVYQDSGTMPVMDPDIPVFPYRGV